MEGDEHYGNRSSFQLLLPLGCPTIFDKIHLTRTGVQCEKCKKFNRHGTKTRIENKFLADARVLWHK
jgi:hypothetical protein